MFLGLNFFGVYKSFGVNKFIKPSTSSSISRKSEILFNSLINNIKNKNDLLNSKIDNIEIGDLIYDGYLKRYYKYTLDIKSKEFHKYLKNFINFIYFGIII